MDSLKVHIEQILSKIQGIYAFKSVFSTKTYLNSLLPAHGLWFYLTERKLVPSFYIICAISLFSSFSGTLIHSNFVSSYRGLQWFLILGFAQWTATNLKKENFKFIALSIITLSYFLIPLEYFFYEKEFIKHLYGYEFRSFTGLVGEPNYSGALISSIGLICLSLGWRKIYLLSIPLILFYFNRSGLLAILSFSPLIFLSKYEFKLKKVIHWVITFAFILSPIIFIAVDKNLPIDIKQEIEEDSNGRYHTFVGYSYLGLENPIGTGFFREDLVDPNYFLSKTNLRYLDGGNNNIQQHNTLIQVWSELGPFVYFIFSIFLFRTFRNAYKVESKLAFALQGVFFNYLFLNGLNELAFNLFLGISWSSIFLKPHTPNLSTASLQAG